MARVAIVGNYNIDLIIGQVSSMPPWGTEVLVDTMVARTAGSAGNSALVLGHLGAPVLPVGMVGDDDYGHLIIRELSQLGLPTNLITQKPGRQTGVGFTILRADGERVFLTYLGTLAEYSDHDLLAAIDDVSECDYVLFAGYNLLPGLTTAGIRQFFATVKARGCTLLFDTGWDVNNWPQDSIESVQILLEYVDYFLPNLAEARAISQERGDLHDVGRTLLGLGPQAIVIKLGPDGCTYFDRHQVVEAKGVKVKATDTTGAGDSFNAAFIYGLLHNWSIQNTLAFANRLAAYVIQRYVDRYPSLSDVCKN